MGGFHSPSPFRVSTKSLTDGSATLLQTHIVPTNGILQLEVNVTFYKTSDGSETAVIKEFVSFKNVSGTVTQLNAQPIRAERVRTKSAYVLTYDVATANTVKINGTGENGLYATSRVMRV